MGEQVGFAWARPTAKQDVFEVVGFDGGGGGGGGQRPSGVTLRPYQTEAVESIFRDLVEFNSTLLVMPTGTGKSRTFAEVAHRWKGRVLVLIHREEIAMQLKATLERVTGEAVGLEMNVWHSCGERIVVGMVQTLSRKSRIADHGRDDFTLVIVDEAHHAAAKTYRAIIEHFECAKVLGVTATPDRSDRKALGEVFQSVAFVYEIADAIRDSYLVPIKSQRVWVEDLDLSSVKTTAGDLNQGQLDDAMGSETVLEGVARPTFDLAADRPTVVFTTGQENAVKLTDIFNHFRPECARFVVSDERLVSSDDRRRNLADFEAGRFQFLVNVGIATEGWDCPRVGCVAIGRPTKSRALYTQMVGRGLRPFAGKDGCLVLDFCGNAGRHSLIGPEDVLGGRFSDEEVELAKEIAGRKPGRDAQENLAEARMAIEQRSLAAAERAKREMRYQTQAFDPFAVFHLDRGDDDYVEAQFGRKAPTPKQIGALVKWAKMDPKEANRLSRRQASKVLDAMNARAKKGLATAGQLKLLQRYGFTDPNIYFSTASTLIEALKSNGWRPLPFDRVSSILGSRTAGVDG